QPLDVGGLERSPRVYLPGHHYPVGGDQRLARHPARRISTEAMIQNRVADLVRHLVRMAHGNRFAREQVSFGSHDNLPCKEGANRASTHMRGIIGEEFAWVQLEPEGILE